MSILSGSLGYRKAKPKQPTQADTDRTTQQGREQSGIAALKEAIALFDEDYGKGMEANARASASSQAVKAGLGGTTRPGAVSAGLTAEFEDMRKGRLATALSNLSNFLGSYRDPFAVTPGVELGQQSLAQQGSAQAGQLGLNYAQLGQQNKQFNAELDLGYANLNARNNQPTAPGSGGSMWEPIDSGSPAPPAPSAPSFSSDWGDFDPAAANARLGNAATGF